MTDTRQAAKRTSKVREEIDTSLRQFREKLEDVESVVAVYTNDNEIVAAALNVLVSILQTIEDIIAYYWANKGLDKLKQLQLDHIKLTEEQSRLADAQSRIKESGRKMVIEQQGLASGLDTEASVDERNAAANELHAAANIANATISAVALNAFERLAQEHLAAKGGALRLYTHLIATNARLLSELEAERSRSRDHSPPGPPRMSQPQLLRLMNLDMDFDISNAEDIDMDVISDSADIVNRHDQGWAEQLVSDCPLRFLRHYAATTRQKCILGRNAY
ncbi:uncharacterized protein FTOL_01519 [Fusarium torulosum]|uniref:Uncharacterized protein n=1 Tax=Fusarium torulosum TaxID=33205 RepID=A0AAE8SDU1_9HYPO|nr:uncharacterized protein FTOL_01519 [Fusarium torulosum]